MWPPEYKDGFKVVAGDAVMEVKKIAGFLVFHFYEKEAKSGMYIVLLREIFYEEATAALFIISYDGMDDEEAGNLTRKFDWSKMIPNIIKGIFSRSHISRFLVRSLPQKLGR